MGTCCGSAVPIAPEVQSQDKGTAFKKGGQLDLSSGPVEARHCTDVVWVALFIAHVFAFWLFSLTGVSDGNPWKLVIPRDYQGQYCGAADQWNGGTDMESYHNALYTLNISSTIDVVAEEFICSSGMQDVLVPAVINATDYDVACPAKFVNGKTSFSTMLEKYKLDPVDLLTGTGTSSILTDVTKYFHPVCVPQCSYTSSHATDTYIYSPAPDNSWYTIWTTMSTYCDGAGATQCQNLISQFRFSALPSNLCPYSDKKMCVLIPGIKFTELASGYCTIQVDGGIVDLASSMTTYLNGLAQSSILTDVAGASFDAALGDIQGTWDVFIIVCLLSFVGGLTFLVLLRFCVKPLVWLSILIVFLSLVLGGALSFVYSGMCADSTFTDAANSQASTVSGATASECGGLFEIQNEDGREFLKYSAFIIWTISLIFAVLICCLFNRIRLAIAVNEVAAMFVYQTPHIILVPVIQSFVSACWCAFWMFLASFLLSQVPADYVPTGCYTDYLTAFGTDDTPGECTDTASAGFVWKDEISTDCINDRCCWRCAPPRYVFDIRFAFSFFSFLWHNAFFVACGQCIIAGAVGIWFFIPSGQKGSSFISRMGVTTSVYNTFVYHSGSMAFGSFILAVVQFVKWFMYYLNEQAKAQKNKVVEYITACLGYCLWCFEKCVKFLNKNAYIQVALMSTSFCESAKNAFFLILRNAGRFGIMGMLGAVIHRIGKLFIMMITGALGFLVLQSIHPDINTPVVLVLLYAFIGFQIGSLFMNVFGLAVDTTLQCFIATEEMGIGKDHIPTKLQQFVEESVDKANS